MAYDVVYKPASVVAQCMQVPIFPPTSCPSSPYNVRTMYGVQLSVSDSEIKAPVRFSTSSFSSPESPARLSQLLHCDVLIDHCTEHSMCQ